MITRPCPEPAVRAGTTLAASGMSLLAALFLTACGGGGGGMPPAPPPPPAADELPLSATANVDSWEAYAVSLAPSETAQPLKLDLVTSVPTSETASPVALP